MAIDRFYLEGGQAVEMISRVPGDPEMVVIAPIGWEPSDDNLGGVTAVALADLVSEANPLTDVVEAYNTLPPVWLTEKEQKSLGAMASELVALRLLYDRPLARIKEIEEALRFTAASTGKTFTAFGLQLVHVGAGVNTGWDTARLNELALTFPAIATARKVSLRKPSGSIRGTSKVVEVAEGWLRVDDWGDALDSLAQATALQEAQVVLQMRAAAEEAALQVVEQESEAKASRTEAAVAAWRQEGTPPLTLHAEPFDVGTATLTEN